MGEAAADIELASLSVGKIYVFSESKSYLTVCYIRGTVVSFGASWLCACGMHLLVNEHFHPRSVQVESSIRFLRP